MKQYRIIIALMFVPVMLMGCTSYQYTDDTSEKVLASARSMAEVWLDTLPGEPEITGMEMLQGAKIGDSIYAGYYATDIAEGTFTLDGNTYLICVDTETEQVYSDYYLEEMDLNKAVENQMKPYFEQYGYTDDFTVSGTFISYHLVSHGIRDTKGKELDTEVTVPNYFESSAFVIPVEINDADPDIRAELLLEGAPLDGFDVIIDTEDSAFIEVYPDILKAYLTGSGNYRKEFGYNESSIYHLYAAGSEEDPIMELTHTGDLQEMDVREEKTSMIRTDDILSLTELIGRSYKECGLSDEPEDAVIKVSGMFFELPTSGTACLEAGDENSDLSLTSAELYVQDHALQDFYDGLVDLYGGPVDTGEDPSIRKSTAVPESGIFSMPERHVSLSVREVKKTL